jgi:16S rRNA (guanine527-N7)-methyltransferase
MPCLMNEPNPLWTELAARAGIALSELQLQQLSQYLELLEAANQRMNLTRIIDRATAEVQHVGDALTALPFLPAEAHRLADVGTGGGVPGIPLAIARPEVSVVLIEATKKKAAFLKQAVETIGLKNVTVLDVRAEDAGRGPLRDQCEVAVARAVATMDWLTEWCLPLVKKGGCMLAMKGPKVMDELGPAEWAIRSLSGASPVVHPIELPGTENRVIVEIRKIKPTDERFPRPATAAKGEALR